MANSKYEYVKLFEQPDQLLPNTWVVVRIDGRGFTKFANKYNFEKPNDKRALDLMNAAARQVLIELPDITIAYGVSDEYSFVLHKTCTLFERRASKLVSTVVSTFTAYYIFLWSTYFPETPLTAPLPSFDSRAVCYPSLQNLRDYMSWRQVDCHINNLYNTTFWALIQLGGMSSTEAGEKLSVSLRSNGNGFSKDKNELLYSQFSINYNNEPEIYKKGSVVSRDYELVEPGTHNTASEGESMAELAAQPQSKTQAENDGKRRTKARVVIEHLDIIRDDFWDRRPWLLSNKPGKIPKEP
ncbi:tRNAHis guanylyltransferase-domain-containing protein [Lasiosphaeria miniovina]|uniref:tRNA(His) guanylyltransferase n=1 Tax=Lasiosphaeria miniovina TaxID=1954250 RepID=A0AA40BHA8_9PEZI|nr:tRNAHis guanylyltransferase-domain-containing protein [Lasiosphaeria miniovina]KAK0734232.1 tRNAHis guanylyltransferase-domain-containing protein [Lasiosphaeria miniovina]